MRKPIARWRDGQGSSSGAPFPPQTFPTQALAFVRYLLVLQKERWLFEIAVLAQGYLCQAHRDFLGNHIYAFISDPHWSLRVTMVSQRVLELMFLVFLPLASSMSLESSLKSGSTLLMRRNLADQEALQNLPLARMLRSVRRMGRDEWHLPRF